MMRSSSAPVNLKTRSLRRMGSTGVLIRVMSATPRPAILDDATETEIGRHMHVYFLVEILATKSATF